MTHADELISWLQELGYTHCFFVAGGNSMHLLNSARQSMNCVPFVHEVSAGIAAEYFNEASRSGDRAFVLVTAGPGLTNIVTAIAGAYLESRELLVIGGQVKSSDLASDGLRQRGIQEIGGVEIVRPITKASVQIRGPVIKESFIATVNLTSSGRPGPVFIECCLDAQGASVNSETKRSTISLDNYGESSAELNHLDVVTVVDLLRNSRRPILLLGGGVPRSYRLKLSSLIERLSIPVMTTWNGADRYGSDQTLYFGRPNTWGQRYSNILLQQSDLVLAIGTRLGLQQTGFNWQEFVPQGHPTVTASIHADSVDFFDGFAEKCTAMSAPMWTEWASHCDKVKTLLPLSEDANTTHDGFLNPYTFVLKLSELCDVEDVIIPCSSGGAFTVMMQAFNLKTGQTMITNKGLASMGYGLAGAIGASLSNKTQRTVLVEGDGGFSQNLQELATVDVHAMNLKIFVFANEGYASIRMTQKNYFDGAYLGCDVQTGLGFPDWVQLSTAFGIPATVLSENFETDEGFLQSWEMSAPHLYVVPIDPEQTYFPKISSRITESGSMESAPLHEMTPPLSEEILKALELF
jgi:acetolactate synthase-1/2/3 large subunit